MIVEDFDTPDVRCGTIACSCGQFMYFETAQSQVNCIKCKKAHDVSEFPKKGDSIAVPEEEQAAKE